mmetsp:Transcript_34378/g.95042  ORF Transcript_34378/g.95042 Transcript_34378/m.95042 type:complete len:358 (+) Transcript_34378:538-1611(+)
MLMQGAVRRRLGVGLLAAVLPRKTSRGSVHERQNRSVLRGSSGPHGGRVESLEAGAPLRKAIGVRLEVEQEADVCVEEGMVACPQDLPFLATAEFVVVLLQRIAAQRPVAVGPSHSARDPSCVATLPVAVRPILRLASPRAAVGAHVGKLDPLDGAAVGSDKVCLNGPALVWLDAVRVANLRAVVVVEDPGGISVQHHVSVVLIVKGPLGARRPDVLEACRRYMVAPDGVRSHDCHRLPAAEVKLFLEELRGLHAVPVIVGMCFSPLCLVVGAEDRDTVPPASLEDGWTRRARCALLLVLGIQALAQAEGAPADGLPRRRAGGTDLIVDVHRVLDSHDACQGPEVCPRLAGALQRVR